MRLERSRNTKRNILAGEIDKITGVIFPFIVRTMIIHMIGAEYLGLTSLFYSILQMLNLMELGAGNAVIYSLYRPIAENDDETIDALLSYYGKFYRRIGMAVALAGLLMLLFLPHLIKDDPPPDINIYYLFLIYLANACVNYFLFPQWKALMTAYQRDDIGMGLHIFTQGGMYAAQAAAVYFTRDYYLYAVMLPASSVIYSLLCARTARKKYPRFSARGDLPQEKKKEIHKLIGGLMIRKSASLSRDAFDSMFVSAFLGLTLTAIYANYYYVMDSVVMLVAVIKTSMAGGVGNSIALDPPEKNLRDMHRIDFLFMWISGWCSICLLCLYQPFMRIWVGESMMLPTRFAVLFAVYFYVLKMGNISTLYAESAGIWWQNRYISVAEAAANLLLNWILIRFLGLAGIITATLASYFVFNFAGGAWILYRNLFRETGGFRAYLFYHLRYALVCLAVAAATYPVTARIPFGGIPGFLLKAVVCLILPNGLFFLVYFRTGIYRESKGLIDSVLKGFLRR